MNTSLITAGTSEEKMDIASPIDPMSKRAIPVQHAGRQKIATNVMQLGATPWGAHRRKDWNAF